MAHPSDHPQNPQSAPSKNAKLASTFVTRIAVRHGQSLVQVKLETGRKHQIRIQAAHRNHPVVGDPKYGSKKRSLSKEMFLHAALLGIKHPTLKEDMEFFVPTPQAWEPVWKRFHIAGLKDAMDKPTS